MKDLFEIAGGTITGSEHIKSGKNNQDAFYWTVSENALVAVVTDGCSDAPHSEVGAKIGAKIVANAILAEVNRNGSIIDLSPGSDPPYLFWQNVRAKLLSELDKISDILGESKKQATLDYLLFTIVGALITPLTSCIFSIGDGITYLNGKYEKIGPFPDNTPPYIGYALLWETPSSIKTEWLHFKIHSPLATRNVSSILIGTDGVNYLTETAEKNIPGKDEEKVGPINQFWEDDRYFKNPDMIRRKLSLVNRAVTKTCWADRKILREHALLPDDATLVVIRRKEK